jgi:hypothetical protein
MSQFSLSATTQNSNTSRRARLFLFVNEIGESDLDDRRLQSELRPIDPSNRFGANVAGIVFPFPSSRFYETWPSPSVLRTRGTAASGPSSKHLCHRNENENHRAAGAFRHVGGVCAPLYKPFKTRQAAARARVKLSPREQHRHRGFFSLWWMGQ